MKKDIRKLLSAKRQQIEEGNMVELSGQFYSDFRDFVNALVNAGYDGMFLVPDDICTNPKRQRIQDEAERQLEAGDVVIFLGRVILTIEELREMIDRHCSRPDETALSPYLEDITRLSFYKRK